MKAFFFRRSVRNKTICNTCAEGMEKVRLSRTAVIDVAEIHPSGIRYGMCCLGEKNQSRIDNCKFFNYVGPFYILIKGDLYILFAVVFGFTFLQHRDEVS